MDFDWKSIVKTVAPVLGTAIGGPLGGLATRTIAGALLGDEDASEDQIAAAVQSASPDQLLALKKADQEFKLRMKELDIDIERIHQQDRDSARTRETKTGDSWTPRILAFIVIFGFLSMVAYVIAKGLGVQNADSAALVGTLIGYVSAKAEQVISYYFGSSAGSKSKDAAVHKALSQQKP